MKVLQILLITLAALTGCNSKPGIAQITSVKAPVKSKTMKDSITYLALGDSYTIGESVPLPQSFPYQLTGQLNNRSFKIQKPFIIAVTGWTTDDLISAIDQSNITGNKYDFVTLLIGVNDQFQGLNINNYEIKFAKLLKTAISFAQGKPQRVFVLSIPDYGVTPFAAGQDNVIYPEIQAYNAINERISKSKGVNYLNITDISRMAATDPSLIAADGLHPSAKMYSLWVAQLEPMVALRLTK